MFLREIFRMTMVGIGVLLFGSCQPAKDKEQNKEAAKPVVQESESFDFVFVDRTAESGIVGSCQNGGDAQLRTMLETLGGGAGVVDFDLDGLADLFFNGGGSLTQDRKITGAASYLFRNLGAWQFSDCTLDARVDTSELYNHGCQFGDIDNDGFADAVITGYQGILVFRNLGDGSFERVDCGIQTDKWATSAALSDFDNDGNLDLFVCNYLEWSFANHQVCKGPDDQGDVCTPRKFKGVVDDLFTSNGDWTFLKDGTQKGIRSMGKSLGVVTGDIDKDGDVDIYVACDVTSNLFYVNDGNGTFSEKGAPAGVDTDDESMPNGSMGTDLGDFNNDGLPDIGVANFESENFALYKQIRIGGKNSDSYIFNMASKKSRLAAVDAMYVGWGTLFADLDSDGDEDLIVNNGHISYFPSHGTMKQKPLLFANDGNAFRFKNVTAARYFSVGHHGRGMVTADFDLDGDLDIAFANCNENFAVLENKSPRKKNLTRIRVIGIDSNRDGLGQVIAGVENSIRLTKGGGSFLSSLEPGCWVSKAPTDMKSPPEWAISAATMNGDLQQVIVVIPSQNKNHR